MQSRWLLAAGVVAANFAAATAACTGEDPDLRTTAGEDGGANDNNIRPGWISPDGCRLYFVAGKGHSQIWLAERQPPQ